MKKHFKKVLPLILLLITLVIPLPFLTSCSGQIPGVNGETMINLIFPQPLVLIAQVLATIILLFIVLKLVWKPYNQMLDKRKEYVLSEINEIEAKKQIIFEQEKEIKDKYLKTQRDISQMLDDAKKQSEFIIANSKKEAKSNSDRLINEAQQEISKLKIEMQKNIESKNLDIVLTAAEELVMKNVTSDDNKKFVEDFLSKLDKEL